MATPGSKDGDNDDDLPKNITLIGAGTIGLSLAALHLTRHPTAHLTIHDPRPDLSAYITTNLPPYLASLQGDPSSPPTPTPTPTPPPHYSTRLTLTPSLATAVRHADLIQEQGPETTHFKTTLWPHIEAHAPPTALFWSSTSGIPASVQNANLSQTGKQRMMVVHPYNPPHIMPLLELVPSPATSESTIARTQAYWRALGRTPILIRKECTGFVANRLAFALYREACALVAAGVISVADLDAVVTSSMGPRWAVAGPFQSYHAGGGEGGLRSFMEKVGGTVQGCWDASEEAQEGVRVGEGEWMEQVCDGAEVAYGVDSEAKERSERTKAVFEAAAGRGAEGGKAG